MEEQNNPRLQTAYQIIETFLDGFSLDETALRQYLTVQGRFSQCSVSNGVLIAAQRPDATHYKTREGWGQENVTLLPEQKEILMLIPDGTYTRPGGKVCTKFSTQDVFDISQTDAPAQPPRDIRQCLQAMLTRPICPIQVKERTGGAVYVPEQSHVEIGRGLTLEETFRTMSLALSHGELAKRTEGYRPEASQNSFYARCSSFMICARYGVEAKDYNFMDAPEIFQGCNNRELKRHLETIRSTAAAVIDRTEKVLAMMLERQAQNAERDAR